MIKENLIGKHFDVTVDTNGRGRKKHKHYKIVEQYPHFVYAVNIDTGIKECFNFGDLVVHGVVQSPTAEPVSYEELSKGAVGYGYL